MSGPRILLIDDHAIVRHGLASLLNSSLPGVQLGQAGDVESALALIQSEPWALVIADINLPGRSGLDLVRELGQTHPKLPVLVLSAFPESSFATRALQLGARGYITKSSAADELVGAVQRVLRGQRYVSTEFAEHLAESVGTDPDVLSRLSHRELEVLRLIALGESLKAIAAELKLSEKTIATYRARLGEKLKLGSNVELTRFAIEHGVVSSSNE